MNSRLNYLALSTCIVIFVTGADWLRFRGPNGSGVASHEQLPTEWSEERNVAWKTALPGRGLSGPIVVGDCVVVTCCSGYRQDRLHVLCFDVQSGQQRWERQFWATGRTMTHPKTCTAAPTPVSDGQRIFAYFSSNDLVCLDLEGNLLWLRGLMLQYPNANNSLGLASSPIVVDDTLVLKIESDSQSLALAVDTATGQTRWKIDRPVLASWTTPVVLRDAGTEEKTVVLQSGRGMTAYNARTGKEVWHFDDGCATIPSSVADDEIIYVPSNGLVALKPNASRRAPDVLWQNSRLGPTTASPLVYQGMVYSIDRSVLKCANSITGEIAWQLRLKGNITGSPVAAGGYLYIFNEDGLGQVVQAGEKRGKIVGTNDLGEVILCSPAVADMALYVRSDAHLWKISETASN